MSDLLSQTILSISHRRLRWSSIHMPKSFNIKDAIDWVAQAWHNVSTSTIQNCWDKTGILVQKSENWRCQWIYWFIWWWWNRIAISRKSVIYRACDNRRVCKSWKFSSYFNSRGHCSNNSRAIWRWVVRALCALDKLVIYPDQNQENYSNDTKSVLRNLRRSINCHVIETRKQSSITKYFHHSNHLR